MTVVDEDGTVVCYFGLDRGNGKGVLWGWYFHVPGQDEDGSDWEGPFSCSGVATSCARARRETWTNLK